MLRLHRGIPAVDREWDDKRMMVTCCLVGRKDDVEACLDVAQLASESIFVRENCDFVIVNDVAEYKFKVQPYSDAEYAACAAYVRTPPSEKRVHYLLSLEHYMCSAGMIRALTAAAASTGCEVRNHESTPMYGYDACMVKCRRIRSESSCLCVGVAVASTKGPVAASAKGPVAESTGCEPRDHEEGTHLLTASSKTDGGSFGGASSKCAYPGAFLGRSSSGSSVMKSD